MVAVGISHTPIAPGVGRKGQVEGAEFQFFRTQNVYDLSRATTTRGHYWRALMTKKLAGHTHPAGGGCAGRDPGQIAAPSTSASSAAALQLPQFN